jgi:simple sugar transport system permease protein
VRLALRSLLPAGASLLAALVVGALLLAASGADPIDGYDALLQGAFGTRYDVGETLVRALPLAIVALGVAPALRAGVFTVGAEGQVILGAMAATAAVLALGDAPGVVLIAAGAAAGALAGAAWALLPALLRARLNVNEILSTLLLNYVAAALLAWALRTWLKTSESVPSPRSDNLPPASALPNLIEGTRLHWGIVLVPIGAIALAWWLRTPRALAYDVFDTHRALARRAGVSAHRAIVTTMLVGGATAGIAGWLKVTGVDGALYASVAGGLGFTGILVALLGGLRPVGIVLAAVLFGALSAGADGLQIDTGTPASLATVLQGLLLIGAALGFEARRRRVADQAAKAVA